MPINNSKLNKSAHEPTTPPSDPIAPAPEGHLLRSARQQMEAELTQLQTTLDSLSDDYADRAETMVRDWLTQCRSKAKHRINAIDLADFFDSGDALPPAIEVPALASSEV
jgi:hypothetical protein